MNIQELGNLEIWRKHMKDHCLAMSMMSLKTVARKPEIQPVMAPSLGPNVAGVSSSYFWQDQI